jgi:hypothetical protein
LIRRRTRLFSACALAIALTAASASAQASAATVALAPGCLIYDQATATHGVPISGIGFTPTDAVNFTTTKGDGSGTAAVGAGGSFSGLFALPVINNAVPAVFNFTLVATDEDNVAASTTFQEAPLAVDTKPAKAKPTTTVTFNFSGFTPGAPIYVHYLHNGKVVATKRFGTAHGACGLLSTRTKFFPGEEKYDSYKLQFDDAKQYASTSSPKLDATLSKTFL